MVEPILVGRSERPLQASRTEATITDGTLWAVNSSIIDTLIRPISTVKALYGLSIKSAGGVFERTLINRMRFPKLEEKPIPDVRDAPIMDLNLFEHHLDKITKTRSSRGSIDYLIGGEAYFPRLISAIDNAETSIDIRTYIFDNDDFAVKVADHLRDKSDQAEVRVLVDGLGALVASNIDPETLPPDFSPPASIERYLEYESRVSMRSRSNPWLTGDHAKITLIDQSTAFVGGMNIGREYRYDWHDMMVEIHGPVVNDLQFEFDVAWEKSGWLGDLGWLLRALGGVEDTNPDHEDYYPVRILVTNLHDSQIYRAQVEAIRRARRYIYIENSYFTDDKIIFELARARRRGVDVRVIVSTSGDIGLMNLSNMSTVNRLLQNGIRVFAYPRMSHIKAAVYDGWACLGSANFDKLSLQINQEVNIATSHPEAVQRLLDQVFAMDFAVSREIHEEYQLDLVHHMAEILVDEVF